MLGRVANVMAAVFGLAGLHAACGAAHREEPARPVYALIETIPGSPADGIWDYASIDPRTGRLYLAQDGVTVLDLHAHSIMAHFVRGVEFSGQVPIHSVIAVSQAVLALSDSSHHAVTFVSARTGEVLIRVPTGSPANAGWHTPDQLLLEPRTGYLVAVNGDRGSLALIDISRHAKIGEIFAGRKLESAAADGRGLLFVNDEAGNSVAFVDIPARRVIRKVALRGCHEPTGLAYDEADHLIITVCSNGVAKFISSDDGREAASLEVAPGADCVLYDEARRVAFSPGGDSGVLTVIAVRGLRDIAVVQSIKTLPGVRLGALDARSGKVYLPAARFGPPAPALKLPGLEDLPGLNPGTFEFLVVGSGP